MTVALICGLYLAKKVNSLSNYEYKYFWTNFFVYLYIDYNESVYYWEFTKILKRMLLIAVLILFIDNPFVQIGMFMIVCIVYYIIY